MVMRMDAQAFGMEENIRKIKREEYEQLVEHWRKVEKFEEKLGQWKKSEDGFDEEGNPKTEDDFVNSAHNPNGAGVPSTHLKSDKVNLDSPST